MALTTPHALRIPEILRMIFDFAGPAVNAVNTQVCKLWLDIALDVLWEEVDNLPRLLCILSPLKRDIHSRYYQFEQPPSENDWKRFEKYAIRVKRLNYSFYPKLGDKSFEMLDQTKIRVGILPNLRALEWDFPKTPGMNLFMHSGIQKLVVYLQEGIPPQVFFKDVLARMPDLAILDIDSDGPVEEIEEELVHLLQGLPKLESVVLPCFYFTTKIAECLSHAQHLSSIDFHSENPQDMDDRGVMSFNPTLTEGAFPLLCELSISTNFEETARFVKTPFSPNNLTQFHNVSYFVDMPDSVHLLLSALSENYRFLREVKLLSNIVPLDLADEPGGCITLNILKPIFKMPHLITFYLHHTYPLVMTQQDIHCLASSCPALENLNLGVSSLYPTESALTLAALVPLAQHCLKLKYLGLFMDATAAKVPEISLTAAPGSFRSLQHLCVGYSIIDEWMGPTVYLSHLLAPDCEIQARAPWDEDNVGPELVDIIDERGSTWNKVITMVPVLSKVRAQERRRMRAILEDLRVDVAMMDPTAVGVKLESLSAALA